MNRITMHHAASGYTLSKEAFEHYHRIIDGDGEVHNGRHAIEDNLPGNGGSYAAHTLNLNSGNIGTSILAMGEAKWADPFGSTKFPVKPAQVDRLCSEVAHLAIDYSIPVDRRFILSHAEVQITLGVKQKNKWDFDYDPRYSSKSRDPVGIGDELRQEIASIMTQPLLKLRPPLIQPVPDRPQLRQGDEGTYVLELQTLLGLAVRDGKFGPNTRTAVVAWQKKNELLPDGVVGPLSWDVLLKKG
jgi:hypothetical protein